MLPGLKTQFLRVVTILMIGMVVVPGVTIHDAGAQGAPNATSYDSELSGLTVDVFGEFEIVGSEGGTYAGGGGETVTISSGSASVMVGFFDDDDDPETTIELYHQGFSEEYGDLTVLDEGRRRGVTWSLVSGTSAGETSVFYISVTPDVVGNVDVMTFILSPEDAFLAALEDAQYDITIDGDGIFHEARLGELGGILESGEPSGAETPQPAGGSPRGNMGGALTVSEVTGIEIEAGGDWRVVEQNVSGERASKEESLQIQSTFANGYVAFVLGRDAQSALDKFFNGFDSSALSRERLAQDYRHGVAWSLDHAVLGDGAEVYVYAEIQEGLDPDYLVLSTVLAKPDDFLDEMASAQANITLDGEPMFSDVDIDALGETLSGGLETTPQPDATAGGKASDSGNPREHAKLPGEGGPNAGTPGAGDLDFTAAGLISGNNYASPRFGTDVTWGPSWGIDPSDPDSVTSDPADSWDSLMLIRNGPGFAMVFIDISTADGLIPAGFVEYWASGEYQDEYLSPDAEILLQRSRGQAGAVVMRDYLDVDTEVVIVKEAILLDDGEHLAIVTMAAAPEMFAEAYLDAQEDLDIGDGPGLNTFTGRQIKRALDR